MRPQAGFTLIELMVTLTILAVLATVALPLTQIAAQRTREEELRRDLWQMRAAIDAYKQAVDDGRITKSIEDTGFPPTLNVLVEGVKDMKDPAGNKMYFLRRIPRDPFCDCPSKKNDETWGKRSYASPPDSPEEGKDVYDVYSLSETVGLNGQPYRQW
ncbi:type II secretion system protein [Silvimonas amylolytica]|uniref:Type II secretion system pseudopilin PulG n=1 Tax=Silvimonas amylolytica TaxID=449663 RepID=A0ABQ2PSI1_9NEIS|nr:type II secretion system protein [Silvimonas amylolytica]GGP27937.1 type II secretion system pseudopilin PulG [Silvimonas amylolytica]